MEQINSLVDKYMPLRKVTNKEYKRRFKPWINNIILNKIQRRNKELNNLAKCKDIQTKAILRETIKTMKNEITALYEKEKHKIDQIINKIKNEGMEIYDISTDEGDLEDVFIDLTKS